MYKELDDLLAKAREGDTKSTQLIIEKLNPLIISSIRRYYNKIMDYDDLIQEGRLVVLECIKDYDESKGVYFLGYVKIKLKFLYLNKHKEKITLSLNTSIGEDEDQELIDVLESEDGEIF
jgi:RNA polymerase sporulation-specific sigma factor